MRGNYEKAGPQQCYPTYTKQFKNKDRYQQFSKNRLCNSNRSSSSSSNSNARIRENRHRRYRNDQRGVACLVARRQKQDRRRGNQSPGQRRSRDLRQRRTLPREKRGKKQINTQNICNTERAKLTCSAGLPKNMSRSY